MLVYNVGLQPQYLTIGINMFWEWMHGLISINRFMGLTFSYNSLLMTRPDLEATLDINMYKCIHLNHHPNWKPFEM